MMRDKISEKSKYYIPDHRRLELKHFCLQYPQWKKELCDIEHSSITPVQRYTNNRGRCIKRDPVSELAVKRCELISKIEIIETVAFEADDYLSNYIILCVCYGRSFDNLKASLEIPCGADMWRDRIRKFYWLLDKRDKHILQ